MHSGVNDHSEFDAVLLIGDEALRRNKFGLPGFELVFDLAKEWYEWQKLPFVFAVWALKKSLPPESRRELTYLLESSLDQNESRLERVGALHVASLASCNALAQDGSSIAAGGIVIHDSHITIEKEVLAISPSKVVADYDLHNGSDADITYDLGFNIPDYESEQRPPSIQGFEDFKVWVNQAPVHYSIEVKAIANGHDCTSLLHSMGIDIPSFGHNYDLNGSHRKSTS